MNLIQLLIFFCQKIQFRSHKSRSFNGNHFSNKWFEVFEHAAIDNKQSTPNYYGDQDVRHSKLYGGMNDVTKTITLAPYELWCHHLFFRVTIKAF